MAHSPPRSPSRSTVASSARRRAFPQRWLLAEPVAEKQAAALRRELDVSAPFARLLIRRGFGAPEAAAAFLDAKLDGLHDPMTLPDMPAAVERILEAVREKQRIVLFGDYDVDGVSATALLARYFRLLKHPVQALVPEREKGGYGLSGEAVARIRACQPDLLITLDNGIGAHEPLAALRSDGVDAIVLDHHHVGAGGLPPARAVVNPKRPDSTYPFADLCGAGLSFKLAWALSVGFSRSRKVSPEFRAFLLDALSLAALGTLADVVPLVGENRVLAAQGLKALCRPATPGLAVLLEACNIREAPVAHDVTYRLAPRLNAAGRCGQAAEALELLLTDDPVRAVELAKRLDALNRERQSIEQEILAQARAEAAERLGAPGAPAALFLASAHWHPGVIGIVASRLVEEFYRPAVLVAVDARRGVARGSGRSIPGFHLAEAFAASGEHLESFGGHAAAAGLTVRLEALDAFRAAFEAAAAKALKPEDLRPAIHIEEALPLSAVDDRFCGELRRLAPCGAGNPAPTLAAFGVEVAGQVRPLGSDEKHVSFYARQDEAVRRTVGFNFGEHFNALCDLAASGPLDLAFQPELNTFRGETAVELRLQAFRAGTGETVGHAAGAGA
jgi:single-stranded-DNA-specific exonuclease